MIELFLNLSSCKKKDCKYHAREYAMNGCDYCFLTNIPRQSSIKNCNKYMPCSEKEKQIYRQKQMEINSELDRLYYLALLRKDDEDEII